MFACWKERRSCPHTVDCRCTRQNGRVVPRLAAQSQNVSHFIKARVVTYNSSRLAHKIFEYDTHTTGPLWPLTKRRSARACMREESSQALPSARLIATCARRGAGLASVSSFVPSSAAVRTTNTYPLLVLSYPVLGSHPARLPRWFDNKSRAFTFAPCPPCYDLRSVVQCNAIELYYSCRALRFARNTPVLSCTVVSM